MSASTASAPSSSNPYTTPAFWERLWRSAGVQSVGLFTIAYFIYGSLPQVGASSETLSAFYEGNRTRILIATVFSGMAILNLAWFAAAIRVTVADAGRDGWGGAATAASAAVAALLLLPMTVVAALSYSIAGSGNPTFVSGVHDLAWAGIVLSSFPRAMLVMSAAFGLWRAKLISNALFSVGVAAVVLVLMGGTTWFSDGFWAPDGLYSRFISPAICVAWVLIVSRVLLSRSPVTRAGW